MVNSDDEIIDCKSCGTMSNVELLKKIPMLNAEDMNRKSLIQELKRQQSRTVQHLKYQHNIFIFP